ncbi:uncharacterized protein LOC112085299 [Eutrema salsugineum]|uniref:uncharacterized protein LOC112085299 n=1 Tax=Eutrema salsugineum TaxID=72664 RepID=UPI000CED3BC1|nr:uncharacterized protein LOC112085299 [Eutrema salsugineum]
MDAFSGYNQILMHLDDREKTVFITNRGIYCYKVMPFVFKNAGATYQRLVNKMFADFLIELPTEATIEPTPDDVWTLYVDGSSSKHGSGIGIRLTSPTGEILKHSFRLNFHASNNKAEYEAQIAGLRLAQGINVRKIRAFFDSQLVAYKFNGEYKVKDGRMGAYLRVVQDLVRKFDEFELTRIPRGENASTDALAALASTSDPDLRQTIPVKFIEHPSIE